MKEIKEYTNGEIYQFCLDLNELQIGEINFPIEAGFYLNKNFETLLVLGKEIDDERQKILLKYVDETGEKVADEKINEANEELLKFFNLTQEVSFYPVKLSSLSKVDLNFNKIRFLSNMVKDDLSESEE